MAGVRRQSANCGGGEEEEDDNDGDNNDKDGVEDAKDAVPPRRPQGPGGEIQQPWIPCPPPRDPAAPQGGGGCRHQGEVEWGGAMSRPSRATLETTLDFRK